MQRLQASSIRSERQWRSVTGYSQEQFSRLLSVFAFAYEQTMGKTIEVRTALCPKSPLLQSYEELLLFTLFSLKSGLTYDALGFVSGMDGSNAKRNQAIGITVVEAALQQLGVLPARAFSTVEEFYEYVKGHDTLLIDALEHRTQRPLNDEEQRENYSGKKKATQ